MRRLGAIVLSGALLAASGAAPLDTAASWTTRQVASGSVTAASSACTTPGLYSSAARGRLITGTLLGAPLDPTAGLAGIDVVHDGALATPNPSTALPAGADAWRTPLAASVLNGGVSAGGSASLPLGGGTGIWTQYAAAHSTGSSIGASGAVTSSGAIDTGSMSAGTAPTLGTLDVSSILAASGGDAALPALSGVTLTVGSVASSAALDGCGIAWGMNGIRRDYRIGSLTMVVHDSAVDAYRGALSAASATVTDAVTGLVGSPPTTVTPAEAGLQTTAARSLGAVLLASTPTGLVQPTIAASSVVTIDTAASPSGLTAVSAALTERVADPSGLVSIDYGTGAITIDLSVLRALNGQPPNTPVLDATALAAVRSAVDAADSTHRLHLLAAWNALANSMRISVTSTATLTAVVAGSAIQVARVSAATSGTAADYASGGEIRTAPAVSVLVPGLVSAGALAGAIVQAAPVGFFEPVENAVTTAVPGALTTATATSAGAASAADTTCDATIGSELTPLLDVLDITIDVQPDAAPFPPTWYGGSRSGITSVTALRLQVHTVRGTALDIAIANASAGPDVPVQR